MYYRFVLEYATPQVPEDGLPATPDVLAIGTDESQGGQDYHGLAIWSSFTSVSLPTPGTPAQSRADELGYKGTMLHSANGELLCYTVADVEEAMGATPE